MKSAEEVRSLISAKRRTARPCAVCDRAPSTNRDKLNLESCRWWDRASGVRTGVLCEACADRLLPLEPSPQDIVNDE